MRVGILTHCFGSSNYGGNLQAYALCRVIASIGYHAEQIQYDRREDEPFWKIHRAVTVKKRIGKLYHAFFRKPVSFVNNWPVRADLKKRTDAIRRFNLQEIPHSDAIYTQRDISKCVEKYHAFITGSDQVWHPDAVCNAYLLDFVQGDRYSKFSYAASIATDQLTDPQLERYRSSLADYQAISVRENNAVEMVQAITDLPVVQVLDPTLLLSAAQWDEIATDKRLDEKYLFCYFLGDSKEQRKLAQDYAQKHQLKIVTLPYLLGAYRKCDQDFGDEQLFDVSPGDFISLIKHADCVFTDSFHAAVFSLLYQREFYIFERQAAQSMGSRLRSLTELFGIQDHFCDTPRKASNQYIESLQKIDYSGTFHRFEALKEESLAFLKTNLVLAEKKLSKHEN